MAMTAAKFANRVCKPRFAVAEPGSKNPGSTSVWNGFLGRALERAQEIQNILLFTDR
jgi:hypothetical protein